MWPSSPLSGICPRELACTWVVTKTLFIIPKKRNRLIDKDIVKNWLTQLWRPNLTIGSLQAGEPVVSFWEPEGQCISPSPRAEDPCPSSSCQAKRADSPFLHLLFYSGPQQIWWRPPTLGRAICFTQWIRKLPNPPPELEKTSVFLLCFFSSPHKEHSQHFWSSNLCRFFPHLEILHNTCWMFCNLTQFWHYLPEDSIRSHRLKGSVPQNYCQPQMAISSRATLTSDWPTRNWGLLPPLPQDW